MATSTNLISGLSSGFDWRSMIDQLIEIESAPIDLKETKKTEYEAQLAEWQSFNTTLLSLKSSAQSLSDPDDFFVYSSNLSSDNNDVEASDLLSISSTSSAAPGSYTIQINNLAVAQKLSSTSFSSFSDSLGSDYSGDIIINDRVITISNTDGLDDIRNKINNANSGTNPTGVSASIITYAENDYRLILTSSETGEEGISLKNGSTNDIIQLFGWKDSNESLKNSITGGAQSDAFSSTTQDIKSLLGLTTDLSGTVVIGGNNVDIDLSSDSLEDIKTKINNAGISASLITKDVDGDTKYSIQIDGTQAFTDSDNILEILGIVTNGNTDAQGSTSSNTMTTNGENITAQTLLSDIDGYNFTLSADSIDITGNDHDGAAIAGSTFNIESSSTVQDLLDAVETAYGGNVSARITSDGTIEVEDLQTGTSQMTVSLTSTVTSGTLDWGSFGSVETVRKRELVAGEDASVTIDGVEVTGSSNIISDVLDGVTLTLKDSDAGTTVTLNIERDLTAVKEKISSFVDSYNEVSAYINAQQEYDSEEETTGGVLFGDGTLSSVKSDLSSLLVEPVWGVSSEFSILGLAGITLDNEGQLSIDDDVLTDHLNNNFYDIQKLFSAMGSADSGNIEFISNTRDTEAGEYVVNITQAATQNSSTGDKDPFTAGALTSDEVLTVTDGSSVATISLSTGMTINDIVNAANTEFDTVYTEKLVGDTALTSASNPLEASTTWDSIDGVSISDNDTITFSGTTRRGREVSGSYTITDYTTDTIQGLLSEIESTFGDVSATIDSSGRIAITDDLEGTSSLSISFDYSGTAAEADIFGTVLTTNDGGQEGRYSMGITASSDGGILSLTSNSYGSGRSFTIEEDNELFWTGSASSITVDNGLDVEGTINGEAATGSGQNLSGNDGEANIDGLVIKYTGTDTGEVGNLKLTLGIAELFDRKLFSITDSYEGYVGFKMDSLTDRISQVDEDIERMEARLDLRMESMINRFVAMELAISEIQSQSSWLSSQLSSL